MPAIEPNPPKSPKATLREKIEAHRNNPNCAACHAGIDPLGIAWDNYDAIGQFRSTESGKPIDTAVTLTNIAPDMDGTYPNARAMLEHLAVSKTAGDCYALQWFRYALKREPVARDACTLQRALTAFQSSQGGIKELVKAMVMSNAFRYGLKEAEL